MIRAAFLRGVTAAATTPWARGWSTDAVSGAAQRSDLDALWNAMLEVGTTPFLTCDAASVEAAYRTLRTSLDRPVDVRALWLRVAPLFAALNDGHVTVLPPFARPEVLDVPFRFALDGDDLIVVASDRDAIAPGSVLVSVEGMPAAVLRDVASGVAGGQTAVMRRERVRAFSRHVAFALFGPRDRYAVRWIAPGGERRAASLPSTTRDDDESRAPYAFRTLANGAAGYIDYRSCEDRARFERFTASTFAALRERGTRALIVDVRENGGGDAGLNDVLWRYVAQAPFRQTASIVVRASERLRREYGRTRYVAEFGEPSWRAADGTLLRYTVPPVEPNPAAQRFDGSVYLLVGPRTFSSGMACAIAAKDYALATVVGEETGEPVNGTGAVYTMRTPATGMLGAFTTKLYLAPRPRPDGQGIVPDVVVPTTRADIEARRDPVLERVLAMLA